MMEQNVILSTLNLIQYKTRIKQRMLWKGAVYMKLNKNEVIFVAGLVLSVVGSILTSAGREESSIIKIGKKIGGALKNKK